jgi:hypothetical protein
LLQPVHDIQLELNRNRFTRDLPNIETGDRHYASAFASHRSFIVV